jgi:adenylylsulfate kinase
MTEYSQRFIHPTWLSSPHWSIIPANDAISFTLWFTGLPGTGKTTLALLLKRALEMRGFKVESIDAQSLSHWLRQELRIEESVQDDRSSMSRYDAFVTYICSLLAQHGIITITSLVSPLQEARSFAREQLQEFVEIYLHCLPEQRQQRLLLHGYSSRITEEQYQPPGTPELIIDTSAEAPERSALRIMNYLEQRGLVAPQREDDWEKQDITTIKARLRDLGYLE